MAEQEKPKTPFNLTARCGGCGKHIQVLLDISIIEQAEFGSPETYKFQDKLPKYLKHAFRLIQDYFTTNINIFKSAPMPSHGSPSPPFDITLPLCKSCRMVEELKK